MCPGEPFRKEMQAGFSIAQLLERSDRGNDIVAVGAGLAVPLAYMIRPVAPAWSSSAWPAVLCAPKGLITPVSTPS